MEQRSTRPSWLGFEAMTAVDVHVVADGPMDAPVLVLAPSLGATVAMWEPQLAAFTSRFRVLRYEPRGHGRSPVPSAPYQIADFVDDVVRLLDRHGVESAFFCGLSMGGMVGIALAAAFPDRVRGLVLCSTSALLGPPQAWIERAATVRASGTAAVAATVVSRWLTPGYAAEHPDVVARLQQMLVSTSDEGYAACCGAIERMDLRPALPRVSAPTLVLVGREDPLTPPTHAEELTAAIRGARLEVLSQAAHLLNVEQAEAFNRLVLAHLDQGNAR